MSCAPLNEGGVETPYNGRWRPCGGADFIFWFLGSDRFFLNKIYVIVGFVYSLENEVLSPKVRNFFHPKDQGPKENNCFPGLEKDNFRGHTPESVSDLSCRFSGYTS